MNRRTRSMVHQRILRNTMVLSKGRIRYYTYNLNSILRPKKLDKKLINNSPFKNNSEEEALKDLQNFGLYKLPVKLPHEYLTEIQNALTLFVAQGRNTKEKVIITKDFNFKEATYWYNQNDLESISAIKKLANDPLIRQIASQYLGCEAKYDFCMAWWSFPHSGTDSKAAQEYHFDLDRVNWIKLFIYLSNVGPNQGPHMFIKGSHKNSLQFATHDGRYSDQEIFKYYSKQDEVSLLGDSGTIFFEDTLGFHKGLPVKEGSRLVLELQFSSDFYGYPYKSTIEKIIKTNLYQIEQKNPLF